jgi:hypothetical protein
MKKYLFLFAMLLVALSACESGHIDMNTIINADGTCRREICFKADSAALVNGSINAHSNVLDILNDNDWTYEVQDTLWIKAYRDFSSPDEMAEAMPLKVAGQQVKSKAKLEKQFRWFYTDYIYTETFESIAPTFVIPLTNYMEKDMADFWLTGTPDVMKGYSGLEMKDYLDSMEDAYLHFVNANILNDLMDVLAEHYDDIAKVPVSKEEFLASKSELIERADKMSTDVLNFEPEKLLAETFKTEAYNQALKDDPVISEAWEQRQNVYVSLLMLDVDYQLTMPGGIIEVLKCGDGVFRDGELHYRLNGMRLLAPCYSIKATSSGKNNWALYLSLLIVLLAIGSGIYMVFRGRARKNTLKNQEK